MQRLIKGLVAATLLTVCAGLLWPAPAHAWDVTKSGKVVRIDVASGNNYDFRVYLDSGLSACADNFAYLNASDANYNVNVAAVLAAKASGSDVSLYLTNVGGYCHIGYLIVAN